MLNQSIPLALESDLDLQRPTPVYQRLAEALRSAILSRKLQPGSALPDERQLAESLKLSRGTVRRALEDLCREKLIIRQHGRRSFVAQPEKLPALPLAVIFEPGESLDSSTYLGRVVQTMAQTAARLGADLLLRDSSSTRCALEPAAYLFIMAGDPAAARKLAAAGKRVVSVDTLIHGDGIDSIVYNNLEAYHDATRRLIALGHRRIAYTHVFFDRGGRRVENPNSDERMEGYRRALKEAGLPEIVWTLPLDADAISQAVPELLQRDQPTAVVAFDDSAATGVKGAAEQLGLQIPRDLSVATIRLREHAPKDGLDWSGPAVSQQDLSRRAIEHAVQRVENASAGGQIITLDWNWHEGATLAAPRS